MISVVLVISILLVGTKKPIEHRIPVPSAEECLRRAVNIAQNEAAQLPPGGKVTIGCEFSKT